MALGKNIKHLRGGRTREEIAALTNGAIDPGTIAALEARDSKSSQFAAALAAALTVPLEKLLSDGDPKQIFSENPVPGLSTQRPATNKWPFNVPFKRYEDLPDDKKRDLDLVVVSFIRGPFPSPSQNQRAQLHPRRKQPDTRQLVLV